MTAQVMPARHSAARRSVLSRIALAVAFLVPLVFLFVQAWQTDSDKAAAAQAEKRGLQYLSALQPVISAVADTQSVVVGGGKPSFDIVDQAVLNASDVDDQIGAGLQTHVLWAQARSDIANLHGQTLDPRTAVAKFGAVTSELMALVDKVRQVSGLIRDSDPDTYFLEDAAANQLPSSVVYAGQYGDYAHIGLTSVGPQMAGDNANIIASRAALLTASNNLGADVQSAVDATASRSLSADLLAKLDAYRLAIDGLAPAQIPQAGHFSDQDNAQAAADRATVVNAATALGGAMYAALNTLLDARISSVDGHRWVLVAVLVAGVLIALVPLVLLLVRRSAKAVRALPVTERREDRPSRPGAYPESASRASRFPDGDERLTGRRADPLPSRLSAQRREWPEAVPERHGWERTGVPR